MKRGFTLIELMAVIVVIAGIALVVVPSVDRSINRSNQNAYKVQISNIESAAKNWYADALAGHIDGYTYLSEGCVDKNDDGVCDKNLPGNGEGITITIKDLQDGNYLGKEVENPLTKKPFPETTKIVITNNNETYTYKVIEE